jgi:hypothetical protein
MRLSSFCTEPAPARIVERTSLERGLLSHNRDDSEMLVGTLGGSCDWL